MADADALLAQVRVHGAVPRHVAIIMDGNGRWARERMLPRPIGHRNGMKSVRAAVETALDAGVEVLSLFAFSQENWQRPAVEVSALMSLLEEYIQREAANLERQGVQVRFLGEIDRLAPAARAAADGVIAKTAACSKLRLNLFVSYGSRAEIVRAVRAVAHDVAAGRLAPDDVDEATVSARLFTADCPDPDLLIRTSGEQRISNFLLWQIAYTELFISPVLWPDFGRREFLEA
ncbi:MAG TPA: polyprenyl diphosphate synthase, partial [Gemmatimonadaceae bacterium]|nr:polyprenyl diphosphate synthase [Gemmatimonadaceae bacterium]